MKRMEVMGKNKKSTVNQNTNDLTVYKVGAAFALLALDCGGYELPQNSAAAVQASSAVGCWKTGQPICGGSRPIPSTST